MLSNTFLSIQLPIISSWQETLVALNPKYLRSLWLLYKCSNLSAIRDKIESFPISACTFLYAFATSGIYSKGRYILSKVVNNTNLSSEVILLSFHKFHISLALVPPSTNKRLSFTSGFRGEYIFGKYLSSMCLQKSQTPLIAPDTSAYNCHFHLDPFVA